MQSKANLAVVVVFASLVVIGATLALSPTGFTGITGVAFAQDTMMDGNETMMDGNETMMDGNETMMAGGNETMMDGNMTSDGNMTG